MRRQQHSSATFEYIENLLNLTLKKLFKKKFIGKAGLQRHVTMMDSTQLVLKLVSNLTSLIHNYSGILSLRSCKEHKNAKLSHLTILPLGVLKGHAEEYSKLVLGSITGCSPMTPTPLQKK